MLNHTYIVEPTDQWDTLKKNLDKMTWLTGGSCSSVLKHPASVMEVVGLITDWNSDFLSVVLLPIAKQLAYHLSHGHIITLFIIYLVKFIRHGVNKEFELVKFPLFSPKHCKFSINSCS